MVFLRNIFLIPLPFAVLSVLFFIGEEPGPGIFIALIALAALWYIRPRDVTANGGGADDDEGTVPPQITPHPGAGGGLGGDGG